MTKKEKSEFVLKPMQPLDDFMFSLQFQGMESALSAQSLINAVLKNAGRQAIDEIKDLKCQSTILGNFKGNRSYRLDVEAQAGGRYINVELQITQMSSMIDRMLFYMSKMLTLNTPANAKFDNLPKSTVISLTDFTVRENHDDFHQPLAVYYEKGERERASDIADFNLIELPKFRQITPDFNNLFHCWLYYLDMGYKEPEVKLTKEVLMMDAGLREFAEHFNKNAMNKDVQKEYTNYQMAIWDEQNRIDTAHKIGIEKGIISTIRSMHKHNTPVETILDIAKEQGVSETDVYKALKIQPEKETEKSSLVAKVKEKQAVADKTPRKKTASKKKELE